MDEPDGGCSWQAWKFGMKREDLDTKLQDQYNTVTLSIQDREAFHNDVREISKAAIDSDEFHRMLEERKQLRLDELNQSLQSASVEIIANPKLIGTDQWQHAIQLFRSRSFDSLVRYFSSYLPDDHQWNTFDQDFTDKPFFNDFDDPTPIMTHEPLPYLGGPSKILTQASHLPPSPRSLTMCSDSSDISTPSRTLSFSEPDSDDMLLSTTLTGEYDDETSQWDTPTTPMSEMSDANHLEYHANDKKDYVSQELPESQSPSFLECSSNQVDYQSIHTQEKESVTPTPRDTATVSYIEAATKLVSNTIPSLSKYTPLERQVRERSPGSARVRRRSPEIGRIHKPSADLIRARPIGLKK